MPSPRVGGSSDNARITQRAPKHYGASMRFGGCSTLLANATGCRPTLWSCWQTQPTADTMTLSMPINKYLHMCSASITQGTPYQGPERVLAAAMCRPPPCSYCRTQWMAGAAAIEWSTNSIGKSGDTNIRQMKVSNAFECK